MSCVDMCRTGRVVTLQTRNNGVDKGRATRQKGIDGAKIIIKIRKLRCKEE